MADQTTRLLCTGDLHIGRRPSRLPRHVESRKFAAKKAWEAVVDTALDREVHAVVLTGDVVDRANRYYEALGPLERGLRRLSDAGVEVFAVAGNHDFDVFPEIVDSLDIDGFHLLGAGGAWTRSPLRVGDEEEARLYFDGWSFSRRHERDSPVASYGLSDPDAPVVGVLHCEVDTGPGGRYAPVASERLARTGADLWLLGHIHAPRFERTETGVPYLYPGSPQPLDPGETGRHGPWLVEISASGEVEAEQLPTATVQYEQLSVDLTGVDGEGDVRATLHEHIREVAREGLIAGGEIEHLVCRARLHGRTPLHGELPALVSDAAEDLELTVGGTRATLDRVRIETRPAIDLETLARSRSPAGELARIVRALDEGEETEGMAELLEKAREKVVEVDRAGTYAPVFDADEDLEPGERADVEAVVRRQALSLIDALERQKAESTG